MMHVKLDINDRRIVHLGVVNTRHTVDVGNSEYTEYDVYDMSTCDDPETIDDYEKVETVYHRRSDGAVRLMEIVADAVDEDVAF